MSPRADAVRNRAKILEVAARVFAEQGAAASTEQVAAEAGVAIGTIFRHFPTKADLLAGAVEHLAERRFAQLTREFEAIPADADHLETAVELTMRMFTGPSFWAALEMWVAARTDPELLTAFLPLEYRLFDLIHNSIRDIFRQEFPDDPRVPTITEFTIEIMTGLAMRVLLTGDLDRNRILQHRWGNAVRILLGEADPATLTRAVRDVG